MSTISYICLTQTQRVWMQSLVWNTWFLSPYSSRLCDSWRQAAHYIKPPSDPALMNARWLQQQWQMQGGRPAVLISVCAVRQVIRKVRERAVMVRRGVWLWVACTLLLHGQAATLFSAHSCFNTEASPHWFIQLPRARFLPPVWPQRESPYPEGTISGPSQPHGASHDNWMEFSSDLLSSDRKCLAQDMDKWEILAVYRWQASSVERLWLSHSDYTMITPNTSRQDLTVCAVHRRLF